MSEQVMKTSRLRFSRFTQGVDGIYSWELGNLPTILAQADDILYQVESTDTVARIASKHYGDPRLGWVISLANNIEDPVSQLYEGDILRIPSPRYVHQELFLNAVQR